MSVAMTAKVWPLALDPTTKIVLLRLADFVNREGDTAWPSVDLLAHECVVNRRTIQRALKKLVDLEIIEALTPPTKYGSVTYALRPDKGDKLPPFARRNGRRTVATTGGVQSEQRAAYSPETGGVVPPEPEGTVRGNRNNEPGASPSATRAPQPPPTLSARATRALNGSKRRRDVEALEAESGDDRYYRGKYGAILRQRLEGERDAM